MKNSCKLKLKEPLCNLMLIFSQNFKRISLNFLKAMAYFATILSLSATQVAVAPLLRTTDTSIHILIIDFIKGLIKILTTCLKCNLFAN